MKDSTISSVDTVRALFKQLNAAVLAIDEQNRVDWAAKLSQEPGYAHVTAGSYIKMFAFKSSFDALSTAEHACLVDIIENEES